MSSRVSIRVQDNDTPPSLVSAPQAPSPGLGRRVLGWVASGIDNAFMLAFAVAFVYAALTGGLM